MRVKDIAGAEYHHHQNGETSFMIWQIMQTY